MVTDVNVRTVGEYNPYLQQWHGSIQSLTSFFLKQVVYLNVCFIEKSERFLHEKFLDIKVMVPSSLALGYT